MVVGGFAGNCLIGHVSRHMARVGCRALCVFTNDVVIQVGGAFVKLKRGEEGPRA